MVDFRFIIVIIKDTIISMHKNGVIIMKRAYIKPELGTKQFAQFENVFTGCNKVANSPQWPNCISNPNWPSSGKGIIDNMEYHFAAFSDVTSSI